MSMKVPTFFRDAQAVLPADLIRHRPQRIEIRLADLDLVTVFAVHGVDDEMGMDMIRILMGCNQHFESSKEFRSLNQFICQFVRLRRSDLLLRMIGLNEMLVCPAALFTVEFFRDLHLVSRKGWIEVVSADQSVTDLFGSGHVIDGPAYACF